MKKALSRARALALAILGAFVLLLAGCGAQQRPVSSVDAAMPVLIEAAAILEDVHAALDTAHKEALARAVRAETTTEAKHAAIDRVDAAWRPIWDVYARARDAYVTLAALARAAALAEKAGQQPSPGRVAVATGALVLAVEELTRTVEGISSTRKRGIE